MTTEELIKAMEDIKLQVSELKEAKEKLAKLEISYDKSKMTMAENIREVKALENKVKALEKDLSLAKPLGEIRGILWANISESISNIWRSIQIIYEQIDLIAVAQVEIQRARNLLGHKPEQTNRLVHFLNNKTKEELEALDIRDMIGTIITIKRVLTMRTLMKNLERKSQDMQVEVDSFMKKYTVLQERGLPSLVGNNECLLRQDEYQIRLNKYAADQQNASSSSTPAEKTLPSGQSLYNDLENMFYIEHEVQHLFIAQPNFYKYTDANETLIKLQRHQLPEKQWGQSMLEIL